MNPLTLLFRLPLMPLQGVIRLAELIEDQAEQQLHDPARVRRELEEAERARAEGKMSDEELSQIQEAATSSLIGGGAAPRRATPGRRTTPGRRRPNEGS